MPLDRGAPPRDTLLMVTHRTRAFIAVGALVMAAAIAAIAWTLWPFRQTATVAVPDVGSPPGEVVRAYLDALNAHDCDAAVEMSTPDAAETSRRWCESVASLTDIAMGEAVAEDPAWSGHAATDEVVRVAATFTLDWRPFADDGSLPEGTVQWGYLLVRSAADAPWQVFDQGMG